MLKSSGVAVSFVFLLFVFPRISPEYGATIAPAGFLMLGLVALRPVFCTWIRQRTVEGTLIVGSEDRVRVLYDELVSREKPHSVYVMDYGSLRSLPTVGADERLSRIVLADPAGLDAQPDLAATLLDFKLRGAKVETAIEAFERQSQKIWLPGLSSEWLLFAQGFQPSRSYLVIKRICDILMALVVMTIMAPVALLIAIAIRMESRGPAIFQQERVGLRGRHFTVYKFRSMRMDAEKEGPVWAQKEDNRVTRIGRFLRCMRLDELPQVFNVLRGDMSFVGPRPERPYFVEMLNAKIRFYDVRHCVKPGITGWAQVMYPYGASVDDSYQKLQYDLYYAKNISWWLDVKTLFKTVRVVLAGEGR